MEWRLSLSPSHRLFGMTEGDRASPGRIVSGEVAFFFSHWPLIYLHLAANHKPVIIHFNAIII